jgi:hypothetical protein
MSMVEGARIDVEPDPVPGPDQRQGPADRGLGRDVEDHGSVRRAAHSRVGDAEQVGDPLPEQSLDAYERHGTF